MDVSDAEYLRLGAADAVPTCSMLGNSTSPQVAKTRVQVKELDL